MKRSAVIKSFTLSLVILSTMAAFAQDGTLAQQKRTEMWLDLYTGEPVCFEEMLDDLTQAEIVFLGERHTVSRHHEWQFKVVDALAEKGKKLVLGIEMMEKRFQPQLDQYCQGAIDFEELAQATEWSENWGNYEDYKKVVESARNAGAMILALNADANVVRTIGRKGLDALTSEERSTLPDDLKQEDAPYYNFLKMQLMVHARVTEENLRNIFTAQISRDATMAETMADYLKSPAGKDRQGIILCGSGHCSYGMGTASRLQDRLPDAKMRILIMSESGDVKLSKAMMKHARSIEITHQQLRDVIQHPLGDYLSVIEPAPDAVEDMEMDKK